MLTTPKLNSWIKDNQQKNLQESLKDQLNGLIRENTSNGVDLRRYSSPIENQRQLSSCVGNAVVGALELLQGLLGMPYKDLSRLFVYYNARNEHGAQNIDKGTYIRLAIQQLKNLGVCEEKLWMYNVTKVFVRPSWNAYREAYVNKIKNYYRITSEDVELCDDIRKSLRAHAPVVFGMHVDQSFVDNQKEVFTFPQNPEFLGSHAMVIVGFQNDNFILRNSWGEFWGKNGYTVIPQNELLKAMPDDFWSMTGLG